MGATHRRHHARAERGPRALPLWRIAEASLAAGRSNSALIGLVDRAARGARGTEPDELSSSRHACLARMRATARPEEMTPPFSRTRRVAQRAHAGVGRCGAQPSPRVQGRVGRCRTGTKSRVASRLKPRCSSVCRAPACGLRTRQRHRFFAPIFRREVGSAGRGCSPARNETRCVVDAAGGRGDAVLPRVALLRTARGACCRPDLRRRTLRGDRHAASRPAKNHRCARRRSEVSLETVLQITQ